MPRSSLYKRAVGLSYDGVKDDAPIVSVTGADIPPDMVVRLAERYGIPVVERPDLAKGLDGVSVGEKIPARLFRAVAIVLGEIESLIRLRHRRR